MLGDLRCLGDEEMARLEPLLSGANGKLRIDEHRFKPDTIDTSRNDLRWRTARAGYTPAMASCKPKTLLFEQSGAIASSEPVRLGVFARMMLGCSQATGDPSIAMIDATYLKTHRMASSLRVKKGGIERL